MKMSRLARTGFLLSMLLSLFVVVPLEAQRGPQRGRRGQGPGSAERMEDLSDPANLWTHCQLFVERRNDDGHAIDSVTLSTSVRTWRVRSVDRGSDQGMLAPE